MKTDLELMKKYLTRKGISFEETRGVVNSYALRTPRQTIKFHECGRIDRVLTTCHSAGLYGSEIPKSHLAATRMILK